MADAILLETGDRLLLETGDLALLEGAGSLTGNGTGAISIGGTSAATRSTTGNGTGAISIGGTASATRSTTGAGSGAITISGTASATRSTTSAGSGAITISGTAAGTLPVAITATATGRIIIARASVTATVQSPVTTYTPPTTTVKHVVAGRAMVHTISEGQSVLITSGVATLVSEPSMAQVAAADSYFGGGRSHVVTAAERSAIESAGIGGTFEES